MKALSALVLSIMLILALSALLLPDVSTEADQQIVMVEKTYAAEDRQPTLAAAISPTETIDPEIGNVLELKMKYVPVEYPLRA